MVGTPGERVTTYMYSAKRALRSVNLNCTDASSTIPTDGIRAEVVVEGDEGLAVQRRGQVDYLPFWRQVNNDDDQGRAETDGIGKSQGSVREDPPGTFADQIPTVSRPLAPTAAPDLKRPSRALPTFFRRLSICAHVCQT